MISNALSMIDMKSRANLVSTQNVCLIKNVRLVPGGKCDTCAEGKCDTCVEEKCDTWVEEKCDTWVEEKCDI